MLSKSPVSATTLVNFFELIELRNFFQSSCAHINQSQRLLSRQFNYFFDGEEKYSTRKQVSPKLNLSHRKLYFLFAH